MWRRVWSDAAELLAAAGEEVFDAATGKIIAPSIGPTRTNEDFAAHIEKTIATDPEGEWIFVVDQLNIHQSEALVKLVAKECAIEVELDGKGDLKHIKAMASRRTFLQNPTHRIRFSTSRAGVSGPTPTTGRITSSTLMSRRGAGSRSTCFPRSLD